MQKNMVGELSDRERSVHLSHGLRVLRQEADCDHGCFSKRYESEV